MYADIWDQWQCQWKMDSVFILHVTLPGVMKTGGIANIW